MLAGRTLEDLAEETETDVEYLRAIVDRRTDRYDSARLAKRTGGYRYLDVPDARLARFQRGLLRGLLDQIPVHAAAYGFVRGRSAIKCASRHLGARWLLRVDLKDFFPAIDERDVYHALRRRLDADRLMAFQLARIFTRSGGVHPSNRDVRGRGAYAEPHLAYGRRYAAAFPPRVLGYLPQGAPTSGAIANLVAEYLDVRLTNVAKTHRLRYTRYADDLHFSSHRLLSQLEARRVIGEAYGLIRDAGFQPNLKKTRIYNNSFTPRVLGLYVDGSRLRLRHRIRDDIDQTLRAVSRFGLDAHAAHLRQAPADVLSRLDGLISFAQGVDPAWSRPRRDVFLTLADSPSLFD